jgi:serine/threonine protein kinase
MRKHLISANILNENIRADLAWNNEREKDLFARMIVKDPGNRITLEEVLHHPAMDESESSSYSSSSESNSSNSESSSS